MRKIFEKTKVIKSIAILVIFSGFFLAFGCKRPEELKDLAKYVDPFIGTDGNGHVFLGAHVPFGAVQLGPKNYYRGWNWTSGYHYSDSVLTGFAHLSLSGTGIGDLGDVLLTPFTGPLHFSPGTLEKPLEGYASLYSKENVIAEPGFFSVILSCYNIKAELTTTRRVGFHRYTFPENDSSRIAINLEFGLGGWEFPINTSLELLNDTTLVGFRHSTGWAADQRVYFAIVLSRPIEKLDFLNDIQQVKNPEPVDSAVTGVLTFATSHNEQIFIKVGISPISIQGALNNIRNEIPHWDFDRVRMEARNYWNRELNKVQFEHPDQSVKRIFYTAMFRSFTAPVLFNDYDGSFWGTDKKAHLDPGFQNYSIFSLWDTYRAVHPLFTIVQPERVNCMINSMLTIYQHQGKLPVWHLLANETNTMPGISGVPPVVEAVMKGFDGFCHNLAFEAVKATALGDEFGLDYLRTKGFIPADLERESVSKALEYAISDWAIARFAEKMGDSANAALFDKRSKAYKKYFCHETRFIRAIMSDGRFRTPFDPFEAIHMYGDYSEGNAWQYTFLVPQDVSGLIELMGGEQAFGAKLDSLFVVTGYMGPEASPDISGLIGMYAHGNAPSHHIAYLYPFIGRQYKTARIVRQVMQTFYTDEPKGLPGNEDCGQMSAWYIFSAMGFYPVNPVNSVFVFGSPLAHKATINLPGEKKFVIEAHNNSPENIYIQSVSLNGEPYSRSFITYQEIMHGGKLEFFMGNTPNIQFGASLVDRPIEKIITD
ncbi:MAG TPA: GH92 family glycosyl hydrolase [Bacteroidales bacterium]|nr:GH92 family glycosyl hydrolase [Bacteroidales bacterium]